MAFPTTYNINYYRGDTHEFTLYPKTSTGAPFDMTAFETVTFKIAATRGNATTQTATATPASANTAVVCVIPPLVGANLTAGQTYVYDVELRDSTPTPNVVYTILTGTITVTEGVS
jgi:hypothetical protein